MSFVFLIIGVVLVYFGINKKVSANKTVKDMTGDDIFKIGFRSYFKVMMIAGGGIFIIFGIMGLLF